VPDKQKEKDFYNECMDCRQTCYGSIESDDPEYFFHLIDEYAEKKYKAIIESMKCSGNCKHDDTRIVCEETEQWCNNYNGVCPCAKWEFKSPDAVEEHRCDNN
jgi:hypothetical protein